MVQSKYLNFKLFIIKYGSNGYKNKKINIKTRNFMFGATFFKSSYLPKKKYKIDEKNNISRYFLEKYSSIKGEIATDSKNGIKHARPPIFEMGDLWIFLISDAGLSMKLYFFDKIFVCKRITSDNEDIINAIKMVIIK